MDKKLLSVPLEIASAIIALFFTSQSTKKRFKQSPSPQVNSQVQYEGIVNGVVLCGGRRL